MGGCLEIGQIEEYLSDSLSDDAKAAIQAHLDSCPTCHAKVQNHRANEDLLTDVRRVYETNGTEEKQLSEEVVPGYRILGEIYRGGQGMVYKATQVATQRTVALKLILGGPLAAPEARKRFEREAKLAASLHHPNIVVVHDSGVAQGNLYIVMDYVQGVPFTAYAAERGLSIADKLRLFATTCDAVEYAHQQRVIHRDLKPANILVDERGEPVIVDFGLARTLATDGFTVTTVSSPGQGLGSLPYVSPEQAAGDIRQIDERTDIYALGALLYELLTGVRPPPAMTMSVPGTTPSAIRPPTPPSEAHLGLDRRLDPIVLKALEWNKAQRYRSAGDFATVVRTYIESPPGEPARTGHSVVRRVALGALIVYALATTGLTALFIARWEDARHEALRRPPIPKTEPSWPIQVKGPVKHPSSDQYHGHVDRPFFRFTFEEYWPGLNPPLFAFDPENDTTITKQLQGRPLWEHFEGPNRAGSHGWSNLYITRDWHQGGLKSLRSKTGVARSARVNALDVWKYVKQYDRLYYQLHVHLQGTQEDRATFGFVVLNPDILSEELVEHAFTNAVRFMRNGTVRWLSHPDVRTGRGEGPKLAAWAQRTDYVCLLRVELDFDSKVAQVWMDGDLVGPDLPLTPRRFRIRNVPAHEFRLNRWAFEGPGSYHIEEFGGRPDLMYQPRYVDIDDLEFGTWDYSQSEEPDADGRGQP